MRHALGRWRDLGGRLELLRHHHRTQLGVHLPEVLTSRFASLRTGQPLEDWRLGDAARAAALLETKRTRWVAELHDMGAIETALQAVRTQPLNAAVTAITSIAATRNLALEHEDASVRLAVAQRMAQVADTDDQRLDAALIHADIYLNGQLRPEPAHARVGGRSAAGHRRKSRQVPSDAPVAERPCQALHSQQRLSAGPHLLQGCARSRSRSSRWPHKPCTKVREVRAPFRGVLKYLAATDPWPFNNTSRISCSTSSCIPRAK